MNSPVTLVLHGWVGVVGAEEEMPAVGRAGLGAFPFME